MDHSNVSFTDKNQIMKDGSIIFTPPQINMLARISSRFRKLGKRFELTKQHSIDEMIKTAFKSRDERIKQDFEKLFNSFSDEIQSHYRQEIVMVESSEETF